jgi:hypothetical protein
VQEQIAWNFEKEVPKKENPRDQSKLLAADRQFLVHRQRRKSDVDPIEKGNDVEQKDEGNNPPPQFLNRSGFTGLYSGVSFVGQVHLSI